MTRKLPYNPNPEHLHKEAKAILKAHSRNDPNCCEVLRNLHHLKQKTDREIFMSNISLAATQFALAMDYGFRT